MRKQLIGRRERVKFPELNIGTLKAKIDTGAYSAAIHVESTEVITDPDNGNKILKVFFTNPNATSPEAVYHYFDEFATTRVKNSSGKVQERYKIILTILLGGKEYKAACTLTNRKKMRYPVLIGRKFLDQHSFMVDVSAKNIAPKHYIAFVKE